jgi:hypothetical protein
MELHAESATATKKSQTLRLAAEDPKRIYASK